MTVTKQCTGAAKPSSSSTASNSSGSSSTSAPGKGYCRATLAASFDAITGEEEREVEGSDGSYRIEVVKTKRENLTHGMEYICCIAPHMAYWSVKGDMNPFCHGHKDFNQCTEKSRRLVYKHQTLKERLHHHIIENFRSPWTDTAPTNLQFGKVQYHKNCNR